MPHPVTVCQTAYEKYRAITVAARIAALKDADFQIAFQIYSEHLRDCPVCQAELQKDGITVMQNLEPTQ